MRDPSHSCLKCGHITDEGKRARAEYARERPIWGTDFTKPNSVLIEEVRSDISKLRGKLYDMHAAYPYLESQLEDVTGLLTCGLIVLYNVYEDEIALENRRAGKP